MKTMYERYQEDSVLRTMVDSLLEAMEAGHITPTETREAAMLAQIMYEDRHPRPVYFTKEQFMNGKI